MDGGSSVVQLQSRGRYTTTTYVLSENAEKRFDELGRDERSSPFVVGLHGLVTQIGTAARIGHCARSTPEDENGLNRYAPSDRGAP